MFAAQGAVVEKLTGKSWADNIKESFFVPLGMDRSDVSIPELERNDDIAVGYGLKKDSIIKKVDYYHINGMAPAGAINSSANDMAKWVIAWINNGKYEGKEIIPARYREQAISSQSIIDGALPNKEEPGLYFANYGFGWFLSSYKGHYQVEHGGNIDGFSASTCFFPSDSVGVVILTNQNDSQVPTIVRNIVTDRVLGLKYHDWNSDLKNSAEKAKKEDEKMEKEKKVAVQHNPATHKSIDFAGLYSNPGYGTMKIFTSHDSLFLKTVTHTLWLRHANYDIFDVFNKDPKEGIDTTDADGPKIQFQMNLSGDVDGLTSQLQDGLKPLLFAKGIDAKSISAAELQKYAGDYELAGMTIKIAIKNGNTLYALIPGQPDYEMVPLGNDKFSVKVLNGYYLQFGPPGEAKITEATFIQPDGSFKAKKK